MDTQGRYIVDFRNMPDSEQTLFWDLDDTFFSALDEEEIQHGELRATLRVKKKAAGFQLTIQVTGTVEIPCNRCLEPMTQPIEAEDNIEIRLGKAYEDDGDRITLPEDKPVLDVAWSLYETIALAIPISHVHPDGACSEEVYHYLVQEDEPDPDDGNDPDGNPNDSPIDSRWDALRGLSFSE
ncbi:MAG: DUF177 domain-containing protein [Bacteroidaceae bacterium]|nr:DUF177 domain-containing protein [Bacteroidaceae bacterium]